MKEYKEEILMHIEDLKYNLADKENKIKYIKHVNENGLYRRQE